MIDRRTFFRSAGMTTGAALLAGAPVTSATLAEAAIGTVAAPGARFDRPRDSFAPAGTMLRRGTPRQLGLDPAPISSALARVHGWTEPDEVTGHPLFSGAVCMLVHNGVIVRTGVAGKALRYAEAQGTELPASEQLPMRPDTIFDVASISKLFTSIVGLQLIESGLLDVDAPVATYLPAYAANGKAAITIVQLLTHTSGLQPDLDLWKDWPDISSRRRAVLDVAPVEVPGTAYIYSDLNMISMQLLAEHVTGSTLDKLVRDGITGPLGMVDTGYNPPASKRHRIAATEYEIQQGRGLVWGQVHDENAWSLAGVAGHAGVFSTARDLAVLGQTVLNGGSYAGRRILSAETVEQMLTNYNTAFPDDSHGLGFELDQIWYMGALTSRRTAGHTGFTGTAMVIDPLSSSIAIVLTNRVHPTREWGSINEARETVAASLAHAMAVTPVSGRFAWYTDAANQRTTTLSTPSLGIGIGTVIVHYQTFVDTEESDTATLEASVNGEEWTAVPVRASGTGAPDGAVATLSGTGHRAWWRVSGSVPLLSPPPNTLRLRWRYTTDKQYRGRGVYVDGIKVLTRDAVLFDGERHGSRFVANGWALSNR